MKKTAIGYIRVSTGKQADEGVSLEAQEAKIRAWAELNDYDNVEIYNDAGVSGSSTKGRDGLFDAIDALNKGDALVVYSLSRLARSTKDTIEISETLQKKGADLVSLSEKIDTTSAAGKMIFRMLAVMAEFERDQISERTSAALQHKKSKGERAGHIPFGFKLDADGVHLVECPEEQKVLSEIKTLKKNGMSLRKIAASLNERGISNRGGKKWNHASIQTKLKTAAAM